MEKIDVVIPYVDSSDSNWEELYNRYSPRVNNQDIDGKIRFRGQGDFFKYVFRCIATNMPWVNNVFLLVQSRSQVPSWINQDNVKIITHDQFIPNDFLPTFNSCTIEMFLWAIPGLSEHFIYFNDDMYVLKDTKPADFFDLGIAKFSLFYSHLNTAYGNQCKNGYNLIFKDKAKQDQFLITRHAPRPYFKSEMKACFDENKKEILDSIDRFRNIKNLNCYIFLYDLAKKRKHCLPEIKSGYLSSKSYSSAKNITEAFNFHTICINDTNPNLNIYSSPLLLDAFYNHFPKNCKYEKSYNINNRDVKNIWIKR